MEHTSSFSPRSFPFSVLGVVGAWGGGGGLCERRRLRLPKRIVVHPCFQTLGDLAKRITRETSVFRNVIFLLNLQLNFILNSILMTYMLLTEDKGDSEGIPIYTLLHR